MLFTGQSSSCHWTLAIAHWTARNWLEPGSWPQYYLHWLGFILAITIAPRQMAHCSIYGQVPCDRCALFTAIFIQLLYLTGFFLDFN